MPRLRAGASLCPRTGRVCPVQPHPVLPRQPRQLSSVLPAIEDLTAALGQGASAPPGPDEVEAVFRVLAGEGSVSLDDWEIDEYKLFDANTPGTRVLPVTLLGSSFSRRDAISAVARAFDVTPDEAVVLTAGFLDREGVVRVLADPGVGTDQIRTRSGHVVPATSGDRRYTTTELLAAEETILSSARPQHRLNQPPSTMSSDVTLI